MLGLCIGGHDVQNIKVVNGNLNISAVTALLNSLR